MPESDLRGGKLVQPPISVFRPEAEHVVSKKTARIHVLCIIGLCVSFAFLTFRISFGPGLVGRSFEFHPDIKVSYAAQFAPHDRPRSL